MSLKLYKFDFTGLFLGGEIFVVETTEEEAIHKAKARVSESLLDPETVMLSGVCALETGAIVHFDNGDY